MTYMHNQVGYRAFAETEPTLPVFLRPWWLDLVAGPEAWDAVLVEKSGRVDAALPFVPRKRLGAMLLTQPALTPYLGPWIRPSEAKRSKAVAREKDLLEALIVALPQHDLYRQNWLPERTNWLPFFWAGFSQTMRYTYRLDLEGGSEALWSGLQESTRREVRKATKRFDLSVEPIDVDAFVALNDMTFARQGRAPSKPTTWTKRVLEGACARSSMELWGARAPDGQLHAGACILHGGDISYYLMGGGDPDLRTSGAASLVMWEAICRLPPDAAIFDFEGSMIQPIERFFRGFGAEQTPYSAISRTSSLRGRLALMALTWRKQRRRAT